MKRHDSITRKDAVTALLCIIFLVLNLGTIGGGARKKAKETFCLSKLQKWGGFYQSYANDNDGALMGYGVYEDYITQDNPDGWMEHAWIPIMYSYHGDFDMCLCPAARMGWSVSKNHGSPHVAWDFRYLVEGEPSLWEFFPYYEVDGKMSYGSYGKNEWLTEPGEDFYHDFENCLRNIYISNAENVPVFGDCEWAGGFPYVEDLPVEYKIRDSLFAGEGEMNRWNLARHGLSVNLLFLDWSARKVGLRELWMLKWSRQEGWGDTNVVPDPDVPSDWPEWMRD
jgi:prepilin-type processing-associated H-X9-DG protein